MWCQEVAHHGAIFSICWSKDDSYIATCSNDGSSKVWDVISLLASYITLSYEASISKPHLVYTYKTSPPVSLYCGIFQEYGPSPTLSALPTSPRRSLSPGKSPKRASKLVVGMYYDPVSGMRMPCPRLITGSSDGKITVWDKGVLLGFIHIAAEGSVAAAASEVSNEPAHKGRVQTLAINDKTKYLLSGDSDGEIYVWRIDSQGWYQLLRKFRREITIPTTTPSKSESAISRQNDQANQIVKHSAAGIMTLAMHPSRSSNQLLVFQHQPSSLKMYNLSSYRSTSSCTGYIPAINTLGKTIYQKASLSADGRYIVCGSAVRSSSLSHSSDKTVNNLNSNETSRVFYRVSVWDAQTGAVEKTRLSGKIRSSL